MRLRFTSQREDAEGAAGECPIEAGDIYFRKDFSQRVKRCNPCLLHISCSYFKIKKYKATVQFFFHFLCITECFSCFYPTNNVFLWCVTWNKSIKAPPFSKLNQTVYGKHKILGKWSFVMSQRAMLDTAPCLVATSKCLLPSLSLPWFFCNIPSMWKVQ